MTTHFRASLSCATAFAALWPATAGAQEQYAALETQDLSNLSIEELAQIPVRSASKREEPLSGAPASIFVITGEEIEDSAANSLPEALRLAPNLQVQQVNANEHAITARGFNSVETANKLLVLIDGRTVYTPLHSGVFWNLHNPLLEDIAQIEVISGPGGTLYGPNAVNGVVSVTTLDARDTIGGLVRGTAGGYERTAVARYGVAIGDSGALRVYGNWFDREDFPPAFTLDIGDRIHGWQAGFRADFEEGADHFTVQGDLFDNEVGDFQDDGNRGYNVLTRWTRAISPRSSFRIQAYYDDFTREITLVRDSLKTIDVEAQYNTSRGPHDFVIGAGVRTTRDEFINNLNPFQLDPQSKRLWIYNAFLQDRVALSPRLSLIAGIKAENSSFTGVHLLPNLRLAWQPDERTLLWGAVSRAVRTPSRIDRQLVFLPILATAPDFESEKLVAFEAGYRGRPTDRTSLNISVFFNLYDDIRTTEFSPGGTLPIRLSNGLEGHTYGIEAWSTIQVMPSWRLNLGATKIWKDFRMKPGRVDIANRDSLGHDPDIQLFARSTLDVTDRLRLSGGLRYIGDIESDPPIGDYVEADARIGFQLTDLIELYVAGSNLLHRTHLESNDPQRAQRPQRSIYAGTRLRF